MMGESPPSKRRRGRDRVRVTRACDTCKRRKLRCSGTLPCTLCFRSAENCQYNAGYNRGKIPNIPVMNSDAVTDMQSPPTKPDRSRKTKIEVLAPELEPSSSDASLPPALEVSPLLQNSPELQLNPHVPVLLGNEDSPLRSSRSSPEPNETDLEGHYVGPSSGVSFLLRVQKRLHENLQFSTAEPIFNFGDAPLPTLDPSFLMLPPIHEAKILVEQYFDFSFPTHRFLHRATVDRWLQYFYSGLQGVNERVGPATRAVILMVMAQGKQHLPDNDQLAANSVNSNLYFAASERHLSSETGPVGLTSIQARLAQCFYLLSESRINHCWSLFGTTARLALAIGLNRRRRVEVCSNYVEEESRKRVFWCAYSLDNYLSAALGRPKIFHDEDIDQALPTCANDSQITQSAILPAQSESQSIMLAPIFHAKLSRIVSGILRDLYGIQQKPLDTQVEIARRYGADLREWRAGIGTFLETPNIGMLQVTYQRQYNVLNLAFAHIQILLYRPFLLRNLASLGKETDRNHLHLRASVEENINKCLQAATKVVDIFQDLCKTRRMYRSFWFTHYYAFCAIVVLYVYVIQNRLRPIGHYRVYLQIGQDAQHELAKCGTRASFPQRYVVVLEELRQEALKILKQAKSHPEAVNGKPKSPRQDENPRPGHSIQSTMNSFVHAAEEPIYQSNPETWISDLVQDASPTSYIADVTSWGDFDSLVLTGLGELSHLFPESDNFSHLVPHSNG